MLLFPTEFKYLFKIQTSQFNFHHITYLHTLYKLKLALMDEPEPNEPTLIELQSNLTMKLIKRIIPDKLISSEFKK